jgi:hypothetical protein
VTIAQTVDHGVLLGGHDQGRSGQVIEDGRVCQGRGQRFGLAEVTHDVFDLEGAECSALPRVANETPDTIAAPHEAFDQVSPDKAAGAGDKCV